MNDNLQHHGIKGQKWGVRRFQNKDGSLTAKGKQRYDDDGPNEVKRNSDENRPSRGKRVVKTILRTVLVDTAVNNVSVRLLLKGEDKAAKALRIIGTAYSWSTLGRDVADIIKNK